MLKCLIVEDDFAFALDTKIKVEQFGVKVSNIASSFAEVSNTLKNEKIDLILSDVKLQNGEYAFNIFKTFSNLPPIIFFSGVKDASLYDKSKITRPYIYLSKPFDDITLKSAIEGALRSKLELDSQTGDIQRNEKNIFVRANGQMTKILPSDVNYIQSEGNYVYIFTNSRKLAIRSSISNVLNKFHSKNFVQIQRAFAVNIMQIKEFNISENFVKINTTTIPVGRKYKKTLKELLKSL